ITSFDPTNTNVTNRVHQHGQHALDIGVDDKNYNMVLNLTYDSKNYEKHTTSYLTLDYVLDIIDNPKVSILKMDIEGSEWRVLKQVLRSSLGRKILQDVRQILLEVHLDFLFVCQLPAFFGILFCITLANSFCC
ncbi:unnamed protein product, partial [Meganyctiphanes norvegica]